MRVLSIIFYVLSGLFVLAWALGYFMVSGLACAFGTVHGNCGVPVPWQLDNESFVFMILLPSLFFSVLVLLGWAFGRRVPAA